MAEIRPETFTNLIQGVSQQADALAGMSSAKYQENCLNLVSDGVVSRMGSTLMAFHALTAYNDPFVFQRYRNANEDYMVVIENGVLQVFNLATGAQCTVTGGTSPYFNHSGLGYLSFSAAGPEDYLLIANKEQTCLMGATKSPVRPKQAIAHFKSGNYSTKYVLGVVVAGVAYEVSFTTPNSSTVANEPFIKTDYLAEQFRLAFIATTVPALNAAGKTGFSITRQGSVLRIDSTTHAFEVYTMDGTGDVSFISFGDRVKKLTDLPAVCFDGYVVTVSGSDGTKDDDYCLKYVGGARSGDWEEVIFPDTVLGLDPTTMPKALVNTGLNTFTVQDVAWAQRVSGDGEDTSLDPMFVGNNISSLDFISGRLVISTEGSVSLSNSANAWSFFPDTSRTVLATDPLGYTVTTGLATAITQTVVVQHKLFMWGDKVQVFLESGEETLKEDSAETRPAANYAYDGRIKPVPVGGNSVLFCTGRGNFSNVTELKFQNARVVGDIKVSAHVKRLFKGSPRALQAADDQNNYAVLTTGDVLTVAYYDYYDQGNDRLQSAWNVLRWRLPQKILGIVLSRGSMYLLMKWSNGVSIERCVLDDVGDEYLERYPLRLDHRITEASSTFTAGVGYTVTLPYSVDVSKAPLVSACVRETASSEYYRGLPLPVTRINSTQVRIPVLVPGLKFFVGCVPTAFRTFPRFYLRDDKGVVHQDQITISSVSMLHTDTAAYSMEVRYKDRKGTPDEVVVEHFLSRTVGDPTWDVDEVPIVEGDFSVTVDGDTANVEITVRNDTVLPAKWLGVTYFYNNSKRSA